MAKDTYRLNGFNTVKAPKLKGKVKITLHNPTTGKNEIVEGENIVTNAVADIFANNVFGSVNYSSLMPLWSNWYGGILAFENAFAVDQQTGNPDPNDYFIPAESSNACVAHAGGTVIPTDHDDDLLRGSPTTSAFQYTDSSVKQVWEWLPSHGNSNKSISALALTHKDTGDAGTGSPYYAFQNYNPFATIDNLSSISISLGSVNLSHARYDDSHSVVFTIGQEGDYRYGHVRFDTNYVTVYIRKAPFYKAGLYETLTQSTDYQRKFTVECTHTFKCLASYYFDPTTKYLWLFDNITGFGFNSDPDKVIWDKDDMSYVVIDCENESVVTEGTIHSDTQDLAPTVLCNQNYRDGYSSTHHYAQIVKEGNYVYLPTSTGEYSGNGSWGGWNIHINGYKKINISSQADQTTLSFSTTFAYQQSAIKTGDFIIASGRVMNGATGYPCATVYSQPWGRSYMFQDIDKSSFAVIPMSASNSAETVDRYILASKMLLTTKWNLPTPVQKTASQAMAIEYTIEEVSSNS